MISAVIVAGGKGKRMGMDINKPYIKIAENSREILAMSVETFNSVEQIDEIIIVTGEDEIVFCETNIVEKYGFHKVKKIVAGGKERQDSVFNGLINCNKHTQFVLIHDGARPFVTKEMIEDSVSCVKMCGACTVGVPVKDTIKTINDEMYIENTLKRDGLYAIQTPQSFNYELALKAHRAARVSGLAATDDTMLVEALGERVKIVPGSYFNIKITTSEDLIFGKAILEKLNLKEC